MLFRSKAKGMPANKLGEGRVKELAYDLENMGHAEFHKTYGHPKSHYDPLNFKKPVQPGHEMERARELAQRGLKSVREHFTDNIMEISYSDFRERIKSHQAAGNKVSDVVSRTKGDDTEHSFVVTQPSGKRSRHIYHGNKTKHETMSPAPKSKEAHDTGEEDDDK
mgnify:CR=1 FL=1